MKSVGYSLTLKGRGYVLVSVMAALAVMALVVAEFGRRIERTRADAIEARQLAQAHLQSSSAFAASTYWLATRSNGLMGFGDARGTLYADGRWYRLATGGYVSLQDQRGLVSINAPERQTLANLLIVHGVTATRVDAYIDTLLDYVDSDSLKRLNGAEAADYASLGLPPPRNDWLRSFTELNLMPVWRDDPALIARLEHSLSVRRSAWMNPNTASESVLKAMFATADPAQVARLLDLRRTGGFVSAQAAQAATGLDFNRDEFLFFVGPEVALTVWTPGMPRAIQYNLLILPAGAEGPWLVTEQHSIERPHLTDEPSDIPAFPLETVTAPATR